MAHFVSDPDPVVQPRLLLDEAGELLGPEVESEAAARRVNDLARNMAFMPTAAAFKRSEKTPFLSDRVHGGQDVATDVSFVGRTAVGFTTQGSTALDASLGFSTGINAPLAYNTYESATDAEEHARRVGYDEKARIAQITRVRAAATILTGGLYFGIRGLTLASYVKGVDTSSATVPTLLGRVTFVLSSVGSALWGVIYGFLAAVKGLEIWSARDFREELDLACVDPDRVAPFIQKWSCSDEDELRRSAELDKHYNEYTPAEREALREEAKACQAELLKNRLEQAGLPELENDRYNVLASKMLHEDGVKNNNDNVDEHLVELGAKWKIAKLQAMSYLKLASLTSPACANKMFFLSHNPELRELAHSNDVNLHHAQINQNELITEMKSEMNKKFWMNLGYVVACVIGVAATIGAFVATGGIAPLLVTLAFLVVSLMMTGLDGYSLHEAITSEKTVGRFDKTMLGISSAISILSFIGSIVLVSMLSLGIVPLIAAISIFVVWLGVNAKVWSALEAREQEAANLPIDAPDSDEEEEDEFTPAMVPYFRADYFPAFTEEHIKNMFTKKSI